MKGNKGGITIATFFQMARDLANVDLKEMARERGKREEKSLQNCTTCPTCPNVPMSHITENKCNKKDNILIYNNLGKTTISCWDNGTMGQVGQFCKDFLTAIHSPTSWIRQTSIPSPRKSCSYTTTWWTATRCWPERWTSFRDLSAAQETDGQE